MAKCEYCGKDVAFGIKVSHSHRRSNRTWKPNVKRVKAVVKGAVKTEEGKDHYTTYSCCVNADKGINYYKTYDSLKLRSVSFEDTDVEGDRLFTPW